MRDKTLLAQLQALPLDAKVLMTQQRIREWYNYWHGNVVISFSGGKDSTVLTYLVHDMYPDVPLVFANTGLEYPEIQAFARKMGAEFVRPKMSFSEVISKYGYPIIGKEVAEAISFARRIVPQNPETVETLERERERQQGIGNGRNLSERGRTNYWRSTHVRRIRKIPKRIQRSRITESRYYRQKNGLHHPPRKTLRENRMEKSKPHREYAAFQERTNSNCRKPVQWKDLRKRELRKIERARRQLMGKD